MPPRLTLRIDASLLAATNAIENAAEFVGPLGKRTAYLGKLVTAALTVPLTRLKDAAREMASGPAAAQRKFLVAFGGMQSQADRAMQVWRQARQQFPDREGKLAEALILLTQRYQGDIEKAAPLVPAIAKLAQASRSDLGETAKVAFDTLNRWGLAGVDAANLLGLVSQACQKYGGSAPEMLATLRTSAGLFESLRMGAADAVGFLGQARAAGLQAEEVTKAFTRAVRTLTKPEKLAHVEGAKEQARALENSIGSLAGALRTARTQAAIAGDAGAIGELDAVAADLANLSSVRTALEGAREGASFPIVAMDRMKASTAELALHVPTLTALYQKSHGPLKDAVGQLLDAIRRESVSAAAFVARIDSDAEKLANLRSGQEAVDARSAVDKAMEQIRTMKSAPEAIALACSLFGRAGVQICDAIRRGGLSLGGGQKALKDVGDGSGALGGTVSKLGKMWDKLRQQLEVALEPVCVRIKRMFEERELNKAAQWSKIFASVLDQWDQLSPSWQQTIIELGLIFALAAPVLVIVGKGLSIFAKLARDLLAVIKFGWRVVVAVARVGAIALKLARSYLAPIGKVLSGLFRAVLAACRIWPIAGALLVSSVVIAPLLLVLGAAVATWLAKIPWVRSAALSICQTIMGAWRHACAMAGEGGSAIGEMLQTAINKMGEAFTKIGRAGSEALRTGGAQLSRGFMLLFRAIRARITRLFGFVLDEDDPFPSFFAGLSSRWGKASAGAEKAAGAVEAGVEAMLGRLGAWPGASGSGRLYYVWELTASNSMVLRGSGYSRDEAGQIAAQLADEEWMRRGGVFGEDGWSVFGSAAHGEAPVEGHTGRAWEPLVGASGALSLSSIIEIARRFWLTAGLEAMLAAQWIQVASGLSQWSAQWQRPVKPAELWVESASRVCDAWQEAAARTRRWAERSVELIATTTITSIVPASLFHGQAAIGFAGPGKRSITIWMRGSVVTGADVVNTVLEAVRGGA